MYDIKPDLTTLGKVIGGGLPVGAYGGKKEIMQLAAPVGPMYQAGTLSGNPLAMSLGIAALSLIQGEQVWRKLEQAAARLAAGVASAAKQAGIPIQQTWVTGRWKTWSTPSLSGRACRARKQSPRFQGARSQEEIASLFNLLGGGAGLQ